MTLLGDVLLSFGVTWTADLLGRRRMVGLGSLLMGGAGVSPLALAHIREFKIAN
jgi:hypothetical protein